MLGERIPLGDASNVSTAVSPIPSKKRSLFAQGGAQHKKQKLSHNVPVVAVDADPVRRDASTHAFISQASCGASIGALRSSFRARIAPPSSLPSLESLVSSAVCDQYAAHTLQGRVLSLAYSHDSKRGGPPNLAAGTVDGKICLWQPRRREVHEFSPQQTWYKVHNNMIRDIRWSSDDQYLASASADHSASITNVATGAVLSYLPHSGNTHVITWDPNHHSLLTSVARDRQIRIWDMRDPTVPKLVIKPNMPSSSTNLTSAIYLPHEPHSIVTSWSQDGLLKKWDVRQHRNVSSESVSRPCEESTVDPTLCNGTAKRARGIANMLYSPRTASVLGLAVDGRIYSYAPFLPTPDPPLSPFGPASAKTSFFVRLCISPCSRWIAMGTISGKAHVYEIASGCGVVLLKHRDEVHGIDWSVDGLALASDDTTVSVWRHEPETAMECRKDPEAMAWKWLRARREE